MKTKICKNCSSCKHCFFRMGYFIGETGFYYCEENADFTELEKTCEKWQRKIDKYNLSHARFLKAEDDIRAIMEILHEE